MGQAEQRHEKTGDDHDHDAGRFRIQFDLQVPNENSNPQGVLKVFSGKKVLLTTAGHPIRQWTVEPEPVTIIMDQPPTPAYIVNGRVLRANRPPVPGGWISGVIGDVPRISATAYRRRSK